MRKVNQKRVEIMQKHFKSTDCSMVVCDVLRKCLKNWPSYIESGVCRQKGCLSKKSELPVAVVTVNREDFNNDLANLHRAIHNNFPENPQCQKCRKPLTDFSRTFGHHVFIEVIFKEKFKLLYIISSKN